MKDLKYELTNETINYQGYTLYRIIALKDFGDIKAGDFGGFVGSEHNLSQSGNCWICEGAKAYKEAEVFGNARIFGDAQISDNAQISGNARISGNAQIFSNAQIFGNAQIFSNAQIFGNAQISDNAQIFGNARISGNAQIFGNARVNDNAIVGGSAKICGDASISECAIIFGYTIIYDNAKVFGHARIDGNIKISGDANICGQASIKHFEDIPLRISRSNQILNIGVLESRDDYATFFYSNNEIYVCCRCFTGTLDKFLFQVSKTHKNNVHFANYISAAKFAKEYLERNNK